MTNFNKIDVIKDVFILLTPFQKRMMKKLFMNDISKESTLILFSEYVDVSEFNGKKHKIGGIKFFRKNFNIFSFYSILKLKKDIKETKEEILRIQKNHDFIKGLNVYIGSEKDIYSQFLLKDLYAKKMIKKLIAVDEGSGFYRRQNVLNRILGKWSYSIFSSIILGEHINYVYTLGTDKRIDIVYSRLPDLLPYKNKKTEYIFIKSPEYKPNSLSKESFYNKDKTVLILTFPDQNSIKDDELKPNSLEIILEKCREYNIHIKPHPREDTRYLNEVKKKYNFVLLDKSITAEELDYSQYFKIINYYSSVVIDLICSGYPANKIITVGFYKNTNISFFNETDYVYIKALNQLSIK